MVYNEIKLLLPDISDMNLRKRTFKAKKIHTLFEGIGIDKIRQITYSANKLSKLIDMQIDTIKITLCEKNLRTHVTSEMITSDATASITLASLGRMTSKKIIKTIPAEVPAFSQPNKTVTPYDARAPYINVALKEYPYLSLFNSDRHNDGYEFKNSGLCPGCEKEHDKGKVVGRCIKGSYYIKC